MKMTNRDNFLRLLLGLNALSLDVPVYAELEKHVKRGNYKKAANYLHRAYRHGKVSKEDFSAIAYLFSLLIFWDA
jgi:hypothetical protein